MQIDFTVDGSNPKGHEIALCAEFSHSRNDFSGYCGANIGGWELEQVCVVRGERFRKIRLTSRLETHTWKALELALLFSSEF